MATPGEQIPFRPEDSPIAWFGELLVAVDRGDFARAAKSQRELSRLGWRVRRQRSPRTLDPAPAHRAAAP
jgi:hypothetical protein